MFPFSGSVITGGSVAVSSLSGTKDSGTLYRWRRFRLYIAPSSVHTSYNRISTRLSTLALNHFFPVVGFTHTTSPACRGFSSLEFLS